MAAPARRGHERRHRGPAIHRSIPGRRRGRPASGRRFTSTKSQIYFLDPDHMQIGWQTAGTNGERIYPPAQLVVPARYNFNQGYIYRLKITAIPGRPNATLYPSIEVAQSTPVTDAYLAHNAIPVQFTSEDFDQVIDGGNFVTKVIYLPDPKYQELAVSGVETLVSTRLEPGIDPILEADKRGTILLIVRLGAIDLEMQGSNAFPAGTADDRPRGRHRACPQHLAAGRRPAQPAGRHRDPRPRRQPPRRHQRHRSYRATPPPPPPGVAPAPKPEAADAGSSSETVPTTALAPSPEPPPVQAPAAVAPGGN